MITESKKKAARKYFKTEKGHLTLRKAMCKYRLKLRIEVLTYYGNGKLACVECGEDNIFCLTLDHVNGGGGEHKRRIGGAVKLYPLLKRQGYPSGYQTLCMNCQWKKKGSPSRRESTLK